MDYITGRDINYSPSSILSTSSQYLKNTETLTLHLQILPGGIERGGKKVIKENPPLEESSKKAGMSLIPRTSVLGGRVGLGAKCFMATPPGNGFWTAALAVGARVSWLLCF